MNLLTPDQVGGYFAALGGEVITSAMRAETFEAKLASVADVARENCLGRAYVADRLQQIAEAAGVVSDRGQDWVQERIARVFPAPAPRANGHAMSAAKVHAEQKGKVAPIAFDGIPLSVDEWLARDVPAPDLLLAFWLSTTSRAIFSADTGLDKTNFALAMAAHIAAGVDFLHWRITRSKDAAGVLFPRKYSTFQTHPLLDR